LKDSFPKEKVNEPLYAEIMELHRINQIGKQFVPSKYRDAMLTRSFYSVTPFGRMFIEACTRV